VQHKCAVINQKNRPLKTDFSVRSEQLLKRTCFAQIMNSSNRCCIYSRLQLGISRRRSLHTRRWWSDSWLKLCSKQLWNETIKKKQQTIFWAAEKHSNALRNSSSDRHRLLANTSGINYTSSVKTTIKTFLLTLFRSFFKVSHVLEDNFWELLQQFFFTSQIVFLSLKQKMSASKCWKKVNFIQVCFIRQQHCNEKTLTSKYESN